MRSIARLAVAGVTTLALAAPVAGIAGAASAAPAASATVGTVDAADLAARKAAPKLKLKKAADGTHWGLAGNKITAMVRGKGKVSFSVNGTKLKSARIKKGKASVRLPSDLAPGTYKVKAKYKKAKGTIKTTVWDSALNVNAAEFTISQAEIAATYGANLPDLVGTVKYKGKVATKGWVDMYQDGKNKEGSQSPFYCCMASVAEDGSFSFGGYEFLEEVAEKGPGTYQYRAFYTPTASFGEYIYSQWITVTVVP